MFFLLWMIASASGGYGDPVDGVPNHPEREVHFWTNAIRANPADFSSDYPCSFNSFESSEKTPKSLLWWNQGLGDASRYHSTDMDVQGYFDHDSIDGTPWDQRIYSYYDGFTIGENIATGYSNASAVVFDGWMCSAGHRSNIMSTLFNELGTGVSSTYYTQDFGSGSPPNRGIAMGLHLPERPGATVDLAVVIEAPGDPDALYVVFDGDRHDLTHVFGSSDLGVWAVELAPAEGCHEYYFVLEIEVGGQPYSETFPEDGSYGWGSCVFDDPEAAWIDNQIPLPGSGAETPPETGTPSPTGPTAGGTTPGGTNTLDEVGPPEEAGNVGGCGCDATPGLGAGLPMLGLVLLGLRRRSYVGATTR